MQELPTGSEVDGTPRPPPLRNRIRGVPAAAMTGTGRDG
jgi:hypothetical protein